MSINIVSEARRRSIGRELREVYFIGELDNRASIIRQYLPYRVRCTQSKSLHQLSFYVAAYINTNLGNKIIVLNSTGLIDYLSLKGSPLKNYLCSVEPILGRGLLQNLTPRLGF